MGPYPQMVEIEGVLADVGISDGGAGYVIIVTTEDGPLTINNMRDDDVDCLLPGIGGTVRITIEPIEEECDGSSNGK